MNHTRTFSPLISAGSLSEPPLPPLLLPHAASPRARAAPPPSMLRLLHVDVIVLSSRFLRGRPACDGRRGLVTDPGSARSLGRGPPRVNFSDRFEMLTSGSRESFPIESRAHPDAPGGGAPNGEPVTHIDICCVTLVSWGSVGAAASAPPIPCCSVRRTMRITRRASAALAVGALLAATAPAALGAGPGGPGAGAAGTTYRIDCSAEGTGDGSAESPFTSLEQASALELGP